MRVEGDPVFDAVLPSGTAAAHRLPGDDAPVLDGAAGGALVLHREDDAAADGTPRDAVALSEPHDPAFRCALGGAGIGAASARRERLSRKGAAHQSTQRNWLRKTRIRAVCFALEYFF